jgi:hypothetical protein
MVKHVEMIYGPMDGEIAAVSGNSQHLYVPRPALNVHEHESFYAGSGIPTRTRYQHRYTLQKVWSRRQDEAIMAYVYKGIEHGGKW